MNAVGCVLLGVVAGTLFTGVLIVTASLQSIELAIRACGHAP